MARDRASSAPPYQPVRSSFQSTGKPLFLLPGSSTTPRERRAVYIPPRSRVYIRSTFASNMASRIPQSRKPTNQSLGLIRKIRGRPDALHFLGVPSSSRKQYRIVTAVLLSYWVHPLDGEARVSIPIPTIPSKPAIGERTAPGILDEVYRFILKCLPLYDRHLNLLVEKYGIPETEIEGRGYRTWIGPGKYKIAQ